MVLQKELKANMGRRTPDNVINLICELGKKGLTDRQIAEFCGVSDTTASKWQRRKRAENKHSCYYAGAKICIMVKAYPAEVTIEKITEKNIYTKNEVYGRGEFDVLREAAERYKRKHHMA